MFAHLKSFLQLLVRVLNMVPLNDAILRTDETSNLLLERLDIILCSNFYTLSRGLTASLFSVAVLPHQDLLNLMIHQFVVWMSLIVLFV